MGYNGQGVVRRRRRYGRALANISHICDSNVLRIQMIAQTHRDVYDVLPSTSVGEGGSFHAKVLSKVFRVPF